MSGQISAEFLDLQRELSGRYILDRELGRGGMGVVFLAHEIALDRPVAIKLLPSHLARETGHRERFLREARTIAQLVHPHIVPVHAVDVLRDLVFFVMAYVEGETLAELVRRTGPLSASTAQRLFQEVAWALGYAHGRGVVHRDVKPENIIIERASGRALVADFGIAKVDRLDTLSADGAIMGTVQYMSPEQVGSEPVDARSDLFSLGGTMYFALAGTAPINGTSLVEMMHQLITAEPTPLAELRPGLPPTLAGAVARCLAKSPQDRFASADELVRALQESSSQVIPVAPEVRAFIVRMHSAGLLFSGGVSVLGLSVIPIGLGLLPPTVVPLALMIGSSGVVLFGLILLVEGARLVEHRIPWRSLRRDILVALDEFETPVRSPSRLSRAQQTVAITAIATSGAGLALGALAVKGLFAGTYAIAGAFGAGCAATLLLGELIARRIPRLAPSTDRPAMQYENARAERSLTGILLRWLVNRGTTGRVYDSMLRHHVAAVERVLADPTAPSSTVLLDRVGALVAQLPLDVRDRLGEVLPIAETLERAISGLRERAKRIDAALVELRPDDPAAAEFQDARRRVTERIRDGVGALERIRTDLLRLSAGLLATDGITAELENAQRLSAAIDAELHGREEVRRLTGA